MSGREIWPDTAKGLGIILVVFGHVWRGLAEAGILGQDAVFFGVDRAIYLFHMPLFFFLSGWFFPQQLARTSQGVLLKRLGMRLFYPMVIWTYLFLGVKILAGTATNNPVSFDALLRWPVPGYLHLWFLWALVVIQLVLIALRPVIMRACVPVLAALLVLSVGMALGGIGSQSPLVAQAFQYMPYVLLGALWAQGGPGLERGGIFVVCALGFCVAQGLTLAQPDLAWQLRLGLATLCLLAVVGLSMRPLVQRQGWLAVLGQRSMTIYMTHVIFAAFLRIGLLKLGVSDVFVHLVAGVGIGLLGPLIFYMPAVPERLREVLGLQGAAARPQAL